jgi:hypothetical protein
LRSDQGTRSPTSGEPQGQGVSRPSSVDPFRGIPHGMEGRFCGPARQLLHRLEAGAVASLATCAGRRLASSSHPSLPSRGAGIGRSINLDDRLGLPDLTPYLSARANRRCRVPPKKATPPRRLSRQPCSPVLSNVKSHQPVPPALGPLFPCRLRRTNGFACNEVRSRALCATHVGRSPSSPAGGAPSHACPCRF